LKGLENELFIYFYLLILSLSNGFAECFLLIMLPKLPVSKGFYVTDFFYELLSF